MNQRRSSKRLSSSSVALKSPESINANIVENNRFRNLLMDEFRTTFCYTVLACMTRGIFALLLQTIHKKKLHSLKWCISFFFPINSDNKISPGFIFGSTWLLLGWKYSYSSRGTRPGARKTILPNLPVRVSETILGRITFRDLAAILPVHFSSATLAMAFLNKFLFLFFGIEFTQMALEPIIYEHSQHYWWIIIALLMEILSNAVFCVSTLVLPELFSLNSIPLVFIPFFTDNRLTRMLQVDSLGGTSAYAPNLLYGLYWVGNQNQHKNSFFFSQDATNNYPWSQSCHSIGPLLGGLLGGFIMKNFFPDQDFF